MKSSFKDKGLHHKEAKRTPRNRDGMKWSATGGAGVMPGQLEGDYYGGGGGGGMKKPKASKKGKGEYHVAKKK